MVQNNKTDVTVDIDTVLRHRLKVRLYSAAAAFAVVVFPSLRRLLHCGIAKNEFSALR